MVPYVFQKYLENSASQLFITFQLFTHEIFHFLKKQPTFEQILLSFLFIKKTLRLNNLKRRAVMNAKISVFVKNQSTFQQFLLFFLLINKTLRLHNLKTKAALNAKISVFVISVQGTIYLLLYNIHDCTFNQFGSS